MTDLHDDSEDDSDEETDESTEGGLLGMKDMTDELASVEENMNQF